MSFTRNKKILCSSHICFFSKRTKNIITFSVLFYHVKEFYNAICRQTMWPLFPCGKNLKKTMRRVERVLWDLRNVFLIFLLWCIREKCQLWLVFYVISAGVPKSMPRTVQCCLQEKRMIFFCVTCNPEHSSVCWIQLKYTQRFILRPFL